MNADLLEPKDVDDLDEVIAHEKQALGFFAGSVGFMVSTMSTLWAWPSARRDVTLALLMVGCLSTSWFLLVWYRARGRSVRMFATLRRRAALAEMVETRQRLRDEAGLPRIGPEGRVS